MQLPGINPEFLARELLRRLDDRLDLDEAFVSMLPSIIAMNGMAQRLAAGPQGPGGAMDMPGGGAAQGARGGANAPGSGAPGAARAARSGADSDRPAPAADARTAQAAGNARFRPALGSSGNDRLQFKQKFMKRYRPVPPPIDPPIDPPDPPPFDEPPTLLPEYGSRPEHWIIPGRGGPIPLV